MKKQILRKCLTGVLCLVLIFATVPNAGFQAFAEETETNESIEDTGKSAEDMSEQDSQDNEVADDGTVEEEYGQNSIGDELEKDDINEGKESESEEKGNNEENFEESRSENEENGLDNNLENEQGEGDETEKDNINEGEESESEEKDNKEGNFEESKSENEEDGLDNNSENDLEDEQSESDVNGEIDADEDIIDEGMPAEENGTKLMDISGEIASGGYGDISWIIDASGKLTVTGTGEIKRSNDNGFHPEWYRYCNSITSAEINVRGIKDASFLFAGCSNLVSVDLSGFDTSNVTDMRSMFYDCRNLTSLDLSNFDTSNVTDMSDMFCECTSLINLDLGSFDTSNVTNMYNMFAFCTGLISLDLSSFDTSNVTRMNEMFYSCNSLTSVDLSGFDTSNVTYMRKMFCLCRNLTSVNLSGFNTKNVTDMAEMFDSCENLTSLDLSSFDTSNVTDMSEMFQQCLSLVNIDLSGFNTKNVTDMADMFDVCVSLTSIDLDSFDTGNVTNMNGMFSDCQSLTNLDLSSFDTKNVTKMSYVFFRCKGLTTINTPCNVNAVVPLPCERDDVWYRSDGTEVTELPQGLDHSIVLGKNYIPEEKEEGGEIGEGASGEAEIVSGIKVSKDCSAVAVIDRKTGKPVSGARIWVNGEYWTNDQGVVELNNAGLTSIQVEKEGYIAKTTKKNLEKGKVHTIFLVPDTGTVEIVYATLRLTGEDENIMDDIVYLKAGDLEDWEGVKETFVLTIESSGRPKKYQLIQDGKILDENTTGIFDLPGRYITDNYGNVSYCIDCFSAGHRVYARVYDDQSNYKTKELGIRISEKSSTIIQIKEQNGKGKVDFKNDSLVVTIPDSIPLLGGSELNFGLTEKLPIDIDIDNSGKVRVALNMGDFDTSDSAAWYEKKREYANLSGKAESLWNAAEKSGRTPAPFGAGMYFAKANIMGYGEGYLEDSHDRLCVNVGVIMSVKGDARFTQYYFLTVIPVYITFGGGVSGTASGDVALSFDSDGMAVNGGNLETEISPYLNLEGGVGADGILSVGAYGKATLSWLHRYTNNYNKVSLNGNAKVKATAFLWNKVLAELDGTWVIYDSNSRAVSYADSTSLEGADGLDMSGAQVISMDYLAKRPETSSISAYSLARFNKSGSNRFMSYAYENAMPRLIKAGEKLYLFYLDGVEGRNAQNQTALFYQCSADGGNTWSDAVRVDGKANETADYDFDVAVNGNNIYVIWSDAGKVYGNEILSMDSENAITEVGENLDLMLSVIDSTTGSITTKSIKTDDADLKPHIEIGSDGTVYISWITNDVSSQNGLLSNENKMGIGYASSTDGYAVHTILLSNNYYPLTLDVGLIGEEVYVATDVDVDGNMNTQDDREIYLLNLNDGSAVIPQTTNNKVDSVPLFGQIGGSKCLFWYQGGNIAYTSDRLNTNYVFESDSIISLGQDFSLLEGEGGKLSIIWTATSLTEEAGVDMYCADYDGSKWSDAYKLYDVESEYTTSVSGYLDGTDYKMAYLGSTYEEGELYSHIYLCTPQKKAETSVVWSAEMQERVGQKFPIHLKVANEGNTPITSLVIVSEDGSINQTITDLYIAPGNIYDFTWDGIVLPTELTEIYNCKLTVKAVGETGDDDNVVDLTVGEPNFSIETYLDYSDGEQIAGVIITNNGILSSDAILTIYKDKNHANPLYQTTLSEVVGGESKLALFNLAALDNKSSIFYFTISDGNGMEIYMGDNESVLYSGKGTYLEDDIPENDNKQENADSDGDYNNSGSNNSYEQEEEVINTKETDSNWNISNRVDLSEGVGAGTNIEAWQPTTPDEKKRYACVGKENIQYILGENNAYRLIIENAMQGPLCFDSFEAVLEDFTIGRTYNIYPYPTKVYSKQDEVQFTIKIPKAIYAPNRVYRMICVTKGGLPIIYEDLDNNPETITVKTNNFYAYALVYKDLKESKK